VEWSGVTERSGAVRSDGAELQSGSFRSVINASISGSRDCCLSRDFLTDTSLTDCSHKTLSQKKIRRIVVLSLEALAVAAAGKY